MTKIELDNKRYYKVCENCDRIFPSYEKKCPSCNMRLVELNEDIIRKYVKECVDRI